jgi:hypothetical protein
MGGRWSSRSWSSLPCNEEKVRMNSSRVHTGKQHLGFSENADGFTRITNPERFQMWKNIGVVLVVLAGGAIWKKMKKD